MKAVVVATILASFEVTGKNKQSNDHPRYEQLKHLLPFSKYKFILLMNRNNFVRKWAHVHAPLFIRGWVDL